MPKKIYITEPSKSIALQMSRVLGDSFQVKSCQYANQALLEIIGWAPDILITGVEIGNIRGFNL